MGNGQTSIEKAKENGQTSIEKSKNDQTSIKKAKENGQLILNKYGNFQYHHKIYVEAINCNYMNKLNTENPLHCPIYYAMKQEYEFNEENLNHLNTLRHFPNEFESKPKCKYGDECKTFIRCEHGQDKHSISDKCHMMLYLHPPRSRQIKLSENIHSLVYNNCEDDNHPTYYATKDDKDEYGWNEKDGYLRALLGEIVNNGYKYDLCMICTENDKCKHNPYKSEYSILKIVDEKINSPRHKLMGSPLSRDKMLALVLYTGGECNYDLCKTQRNNDYNKWKWFDLCLYCAISKLSENETGSFAVYTGIDGVKINSKFIEKGSFKTYVSTSWIKDIAKRFIKGNEGMIIQFDKGYKTDHWVNCCDVSWISKFPDECEILFARSMGFDNFSCVVLNESNGLQTISLRKK